VSLCVCVCVCLCGGGGGWGGVESVIGRTVSVASFGAYICVVPG